MKCESKRIFIKIEIIAHLCVDGNDLLERGKKRYREERTAGDGVGGGGAGASSSIVMGGSETEAQMQAGG